MRTASRATSQPVLLDVDYSPLTDPSLSNPRDIRGRPEHALLWSKSKMHLHVIHPVLFGLSVSWDRQMFMTVRCVVDPLSGQRSSALLN